MKQLNVDDWPRGLDATVAIVKLSLEELSLRLSLPVQCTYDGLGEFFVCLFEVPSGRQYALTQRKGDIQRAEIVVNWFTDCILSDVEEILSLCSLSYSDVIWIREDADSYPWALMSQDSNGSIQILDVFAFKETADHLLLDYKILSKDKV